MQVFFASFNITFKVFLVLIVALLLVSQIKKMDEFKLGFGEGHSARHSNFIMVTRA